MNDERTACCTLCPHHCTLREEETGFCRARVNRGGAVTAENYGVLTALALDPIEKKPLRRFFPGSLILSAGSYGCNLRCPFCQNSDISQAGGGNAAARRVTPEWLVGQAEALKGRGNIGLAYTYNEPLVGYEFVRDCAVLARGRGLKNVAVTNGCFGEAPLRALLPWLDAVNIDLKAFTPRFYRWAGGDLETVKSAVVLAAERCHVEVTTLIIPGENDGEVEMEALSSWLASVNPEIPLHVSRFFPCYLLQDRPATPVETVYRLAECARRRLHYVYEGNC